jgi:hypothetical protein
MVPHAPIQRFRKLTAMTCCVAALCDDGKTLILIADKMIGSWAIESEFNISKIRQIDDTWWLLFAGEDIAPVFDIIDSTKELITQKCQTNRPPITDKKAIPVKIISDAMLESYEAKRLADAVALHLGPIGWTLDDFNVTGHIGLPDFLEIKGKIASHTLQIELLVGGFSGGQGYLLVLAPAIYGAIPKRCDVPGFGSIGSGSSGALYMLYYRELSYKTPTRKALYYAMEAKLFGEQSPGVGESTDAFVVTSDGKFIQLDEDKTVEKKLVRVFQKLKPRWVARESADILNDIPELVGFSIIEKDEDGKPFPPPKSKRSLRAPSEGDHGQS